MTNANALPTMIPAREMPHRLRVLSDSWAAWVQAHGIEIALAIVAGAIIVIVLHAARRYIRARSKPVDGPVSLQRVAAQAIGRTTNFFILTTAAKIVDGYSQPPAEIARTIDFLFVIAAGFQVAIWAREIILALIERRANAGAYRSETIANAMGIIRLLISITLFGIAAIVILGNLGVNVTGVIAGLGVGGIAIGLAAQGIFADLFAALAIIFDAPFGKGDTIAYDDTIGTVEEIGLKSTRIRSVTGEERIIANKQLLEKEIRNNSRRTSRRITFAIGVIYQTRPEIALAIPKLLQDIVEAADAIFVRSGFVGFGDSSLDFELEFDCSADFDAAYATRHRIGLTILKRFNDEHIEFAYPTQTTFTSAPDGTMIMPYPQVQTVQQGDLKGNKG